MLPAPQDGERQNARAQEQGGGGQQHRGAADSRTTALGERLGGLHHHCFFLHHGHLFLCHSSRHEDQHGHHSGHSQVNYPLHRVSLLLPTRSSYTACTASRRGRYL